MLKNVKFYRIGRNSGVILFQSFGSPFECSNLKILVAPSLPTSFKNPHDSADFFIFKKPKALLWRFFENKKIQSRDSVIRIFSCSWGQSGINAVNPHVMDYNKKIQSRDSVIRIFSCSRGLQGISGANLSFEGFFNYKKTEGEILSPYA